MSLRATLISFCILPILACGSKTGTIVDSSAGGGTGDGGTGDGGTGNGGTGETAGRAGAAGSSHNSGGGSLGGAGSGGQGRAGTGGRGGSGGAGVAGSADAPGGAANGGEGGSGPTACMELASPCTYSSQCCSHFCNEKTHTCTNPNFCPLACSPDTYCRPGFLDEPNTCHPAPKPQCEAGSLQANCNRCIVEHCPVEVVYCGCDDVCFGYGGCLPTCGNTGFAGFNECIAAHCTDACN